MEYLLDDVAGVKPGDPVDEPIGLFDFVRKRDKLLANVVKSLAERFPVDNGRVRLELSDVRTDAKKGFSLKEQKQAIMDGGDISVPVSGKWRLVDKATGNVLDETGRKVLARVPWLTERGTFIKNGAEYAGGYMMRLASGVFARRRLDGGLESHVNVEQGTGYPFRVEMDPATGVFSVDKGGSHKLYPALKAMGVTDGQLAAAWGPEILKANSEASARATTDSLEKAFRTTPPPETVEKEAAELPRLHLPEETPAPTSLTQIKSGPTVVSIRGDGSGDRLREAFAKMRLDPDATELNLGFRHDKVSPELLTATAAKLIKLNRGEVDEDPRDSMEFQKVHGLDDFFGERLRRDGGGHINKMLWKHTFKGDLSTLPSGALQKAVDGVFTDTGVMTYLDGANPLEALDQSSKITRLGEGGVSDERAAPENSTMRSVQNSFHNFIDPVRSPEKSTIGLDVYLADRTRKGSDNLLHSRFRDARTGQVVWVDSKKASLAKVTTADMWNSKDELIPVMSRSKDVGVVDRKDVDLIVDDPDSMFNFASNLVPLKSGVKGMRLLMASKHIGQSMPLVDREAPFVRTLDSETGKSYEDKIGGMMGVRKASAPSTVMSVGSGEIKLQGQDGKMETVELYDNFPFNNKGYLRSIPLVKRGDAVAPGQVLATTNYADKDGALAVGRNLRVAYMPWKGKTFEDAFCMSESAARKMAAEEMMPVSVGAGPGVVVDRLKFMSLYPGAHDPEFVKSRMDDRGMVKPGTAVAHGDPLVLAVKETEPGVGTLGRRLTKDVSAVWDHEFPGVVSDVVKGKDGTVRVFVRANVPVQSGDKIAGRFGNKGVVSQVLPDNQMPHDAQGNPFELVINPMGLITRTNTSQMVETVLGKVTAKTGKPYVLPGFMDRSMAQMAREELDKAGLSDTEDLTDPETGRNIPEIFTGVQYILRSKHMSEGKTGARGTGGYSMDETPVKGGYGGGKRLGCFISKQPVMTAHGERKIGTIVEKRTGDYVLTWSDKQGEWVYRRVVDWFTREVPVEDVITVEFAGAPSVYGGKSKFKHTSCAYPTKNHPFYLTDGSKKPAGELRPGDEVATWGPVPTADQMGALLGTMLGDASVTSETVSFMHSNKQQAYLEFKQSLFGSLMGMRYYCADQVVPGARYTRSVVCISMPHVVRSVFAVCRSTGAGKIVTREWADAVSEAGIALWIIDDGYFRNMCKKKGKPKYEGKLCTHSYSLPEVELLIDMLRNRFNVTSIHAKQDAESFSGVPQYVIAFNKKGFYELAAIVSRHVPVSVIPKSKDMLIRVVSEIIGARALSPFDKAARLGLVPLRVRDVRSYIPDKPSATVPVYNITVDETHSYTVSGALAANSLEVGAIVAHGAWKVLEDAKLVRGQQNYDFWREFKLGGTPQLPGVPLVHEKFVESLKGAGLDVRRTGDGKVSLTPMTAASVADLAGPREVVNADTYDSKNFTPMRGGLFDDATFGKDGRGWAAIPLDEPLPNPAMTDSLRRILNLTLKDYDAVVEGNKELAGATGGAAIKKALAAVDVKAEMAASLNDFKRGKGQSRDAALKRYRALASMESRGEKPSDYVFDKVPVLPPAFRGIATASDFSIVSDANYMYKDLLAARDDLREAKSVMGGSQLADARASVWRAFKAAGGYGDPEDKEAQAKGVGGLLSWVFGKASPKEGAFQRRVAGATTEMVGRAAVVPDSSIGMDQVGLPETLAWDSFEPFVVRKMIQAGFPATDAVRLVADRAKAARPFLVQAVAERPVLLNRAPTLHKFGIMAHEPVLVPGDVLRVNPSIVKPYNLDFDGDQENSLIKMFMKTPCKDCSKGLHLSVAGVSVTYEEAYKMFVKNGAVVGQGGCWAVVDLADVPHHEDHVDQGNIKYHVMPEGISVYAYDEATKMVKAAPVAGWSEHTGCEVEIVNLLSGRQILTDDDERAVYGLLPGTYELVRRRPSESIGMLVPRADRVDPPRELRKVDGFELIPELGYVVGAMAGDGWVTEGRTGGMQVFLAGDDESVFARFSSSVRMVWGSEQHIGRSFFDKANPVYADRHADCSRLCISNKAMAIQIKEWISSGADNKHLPRWFASAPEATRKALLEGLLDTDGSVAVNKARKIPQLHVSLQSNSLRLVRETQHLCRTLGVYSRISSSKTPAGRQCWVLAMCASDVLKLDLHLAKDNKAAALRDAPLQKEASASANRNDQIPITSDLVKTISAAEYSAHKAGSGYVILRKALVTGCISRSFARRFLSEHVAAIRTHKDYEAFVQFVTNESVVWDRVESYERTGKVETGYDLTVPGYETFMSVDGVILSNTMSFHVPVTDAAVKEARDRMLPSRALLGASTFQANYTPSAEFAQGVALATRARQDQATKVFASLEEARAAWRKGLLDVDDPIEITARALPV